MTTDVGNMPNAKSLVHHVQLLLTAASADVLLTDVGAAEIGAVAARLAEMWHVAVLADNEVEDIRLLVAAVDDELAAVKAFGNFIEFENMPGYLSAVGRYKSAVAGLAVEAGYCLALYDSLRASAPIVAGGIRELARNRAVRVR